MHSLTCLLYTSKDYKNPDEGIADAMDALKHPEKYETEGAGNSSSRQLKGEARQGDKTKKEDSGEKATPTENPLETVTEVKKEGVLSLVLPENTKVSGKDVYKRQMQGASVLTLYAILIVAVVQDITSMRISNRLIIMGLFLSMAFGIVSVSYTHLDVYKRQEFH